jgi:AcrR family transcriptional regulator
MDNALDAHPWQWENHCVARLETKLPNEASAQIKSAARRLFAEKGVDGVTVREIAAAAGQKNHGAVGYHFGSKEELVRALIRDGAIVIDQRRNARLDDAEGRGGPHSVREVADILVRAATGLAEDGETEDSYIRFITMLGMSHRDMFLDALEGRWNSGYQRGLAHLRRLMPPMDTALQNQRLIFMGATVSAVLSMREAALNDTQKPHPMWQTGDTVSHFIDCLTAMLEAKS